MQIFNAERCETDKKLRVNHLCECHYMIAYHIIIFKIRFTIGDLFAYHSDRHMYFFLWGNVLHSLSSGTMIYSAGKTPNIYGSPAVKCCTSWEFLKLKIQQVDKDGWMHFDLNWSLYFSSQLSSYHCCPLGFHECFFDDDEAFINRSISLTDMKTI